MKLKKQYALIMLIIGQLLVLLGAFLKIMHMQHSHILLVLGMLLSVIATVIFIVKVYKKL